MSGYRDYKTHRAVPVGIPSNAIEKIVLPYGYTQQSLQHYSQLIAKSSLDIKIYDLDGRLLYSPNK